MQGVSAARRLHGMGVSVWKAIQEAVSWVWGTDACSEQEREGRTGRDDTGTRVDVETGVEADLSTGSQGDAVQTMGSDEQGHSTVSKASTHCTTHRQETDADRMTVGSEDGDERYREPAHNTTEEGQYESARVGLEAPAGRAPGRNVVFPARSRENSREEVFENNKTGLKTDEERGGWWGALKKRFYRDMG